MLWGKGFFSPSTSTLRGLFWSSAPRLSPLLTRGSWRNDLSSWCSPSSLCKNLLTAGRGACTQYSAPECHGGARLTAQPVIRRVNIFNSGCIPASQCLAQSCLTNAELIYVFTALHHLHLFPNFF